MIATVSFGILTGDVLVSKCFSQELVLVSLRFMPDLRAVITV